MVAAREVESPVAKNIFNHLQQALPDTAEALSLIAANLEQVPSPNGSIEYLLFGLGVEAAVMYNVTDELTRLEDCE